MKNPEYMIYSDMLPVILVEEQPICVNKIVQSELRQAIT